MIISTTRGIFNHGFRHWYSNHHLPWLIAINQPSNVCCLWCPLWSWVYLGTQTSTHYQQRYCISKHHWCKLAAQVVGNTNLWPNTTWLRFHKVLPRQEEPRLDMFGSRPGTWWDVQMNSQKAKPPIGGWQRWHLRTMVFLWLGIGTEPGPLWESTLPEREQLQCDMPTWI